MSKNLITNLQSSMFNNVSEILEDEFRLLVCQTCVQRQRHFVLELVIGIGIVVDVEA